MKNLIDSLGINHRRFAELYGIPYRTVAAWYTGERTAPEWVKSLIVQIIELKAKGEQLTIEEFQQPSCKTCKNSRKISENMIECCIYGVRGINYICQSGMYVFQQK